MWSPYANPEAFKWEILGDLVFEDCAMVWEPLGTARTIFSEWPDAERASLVERVLAELYANGLIYFFRVRGQDVNVAAEDETQRLQPDEIEQLLTGNAWRVAPVSAEAIDVWLGPTERGRQACANPPPNIRALWNLPAQ